MTPNARIYIAGHRGLVGSAIQAGGVSGLRPPRVNWLALLRI